MRHQLADGRVIHLAYHSLDEWAEEVEALLLKLGCTEEYARQAAEALAKEEVK